MAKTAEWNWFGFVAKIPTSLYGLSNLPFQLLEGQIVGHSILDVGSLQAIVIFKKMLVVVEWHEAIVEKQTWERRLTGAIAAGDDPKLGFIQG